MVSNKVHGDNFALKLQSLHNYNGSTSSNSHLCILGDNSVYTWSVAIIVGKSVGFVSEGFCVMVVRSYLIQRLTVH